MNKKLSAAIISAALTLGAVNKSSAGIPVVDPGHIATTIAENALQLAEWGKQIENAVAQLEHMKKEADNMKNRFEGNMNIGELLNTDTFFEFLPKSAGKDDINGYFGNVDLGALRNEFGLTSDSAVVQKAYDEGLKKIDYMRKNYEVLNKRTKKLKELQKLIDNAQTPAQKQDIANQLAYFNLQMMNEAQKNQQFLDINKQQRDLEKKQEELEFSKRVREIKKVNEGL